MPNDIREIEGYYRLRDNPPKTGGRMTYRQGTWHGPTQAGIPGAAQYPPFVGWSDILESCPPAAVDAFGAHEGMEVSWNGETLRRIVSEPIHVPSGEPMLTPHGEPIFTPGSEGEVLATRARH